MGIFQKLTRPLTIDGAVENVKNAVGDLRSIEATKRDEAVEARGLATHYETVASDADKEAARAAKVAKAVESAVS